MSGCDYERLRDTILSLSSDESKVVVDMEGIQRIDAGGVGALIQLRVLLDDIGTALSISKPTSEVATILKVTKVDAILQQAYKLPRTANAPRHQVRASTGIFCLENTDVDEEILTVH